MPESSYNAPRLHVAMQARKIVISGEVAGLQIQLGTPAFPGRFDSCDLPPKFRTSKIYYASINKYNFLQLNAKKTVYYQLINNFKFHPRKINLTDLQYHELALSRAVFFQKNL